MSEVVVTGMGVVSPIGVGVDAFWSSLIAGYSGIDNRPDITSSDQAFNLVAEVKEFDGKRFINPRKALKVMCRPIQFGFASANMAYDQSQLLKQVDPDRFSTVFGTETFYADPKETADVFRKCMVNRVYDHDRWGEYSMREIEPLWMLKYLPNMVASHISIAHDARGPSNTICQSEASGSLAIAEAVSLIQRDAADVVFAGGTGSPSSLTKTLYVGDSNLSRRTRSPGLACRPFDSQRDGMVMGEGGGAILLERKEFAEARGATIVGEILGINRTFCDPDSPDFVSCLCYSIERAILRAGLTPKDIGHVNASGYSTKKDDSLEAQAIERVLGDVPVIAPKSNFGNIGPGTGVVELIASLLALKNRVLPHVLNHNVTGTDCPINVVAGKPMGYSENYPEAAVSINHSLTGQITAIVIKSC